MSLERGWSRGECRNKAYENVRIHQGHDKWICYAHHCNGNRPVFIHFHTSIMQALGGIMPVWLPNGYNLPLILATHNNRRRWAMFETELTRTLKIRYPIFQAPMAGGPTTPDLVAAVSNAGGLGNLGAAYLTPEQLRGAIRKIRELTDKPFGVNLFVPEQPEESEEAVGQMTDYLNRYRVKLGITPDPSIPKFSEAFEEQVQVLLEEQISVFSFTLHTAT